MAAYLIGEIDMITCKEDLYGTHVLLSDGEALEIYVNLINELEIAEIKIRAGDCEDAIEVHKAEWEPSGWGASFATLVGLDFGSKRLTLEDFKPQAKGVECANGLHPIGVECELKDLKPKPTKFVKVEESIFDLKEEFESGELYFDAGELSDGYALSISGYVKINSKETLCDCYSDGNVYRQVELDWRDEVKSKYSLTDFRNLDDEGCINLGDWTPEGFIKLCHFVAELTGKLE
jgi:hypothetical protein